MQPGSADLQIGTGCVSSRVAGRALFGPLSLRVPGAPHYAAPKVRRRRVCEAALVSPFPRDISSADTTVRAVPEKLVKAVQERLRGPTRSAWGLGIEYTVPGFPDFPGFRGFELSLARLGSAPGSNRA